MSDSIIDLIDGAIEAHGDAMRWSPEPDKRDKVTAEKVTAEQVERFVSSMGVVAVNLEAWQRSVVENAFPALRRFCDAFNEMAPVIRAAHRDLVVDETQVPAANPRLRAMHEAYRRRRR